MEGKILPLILRLSEQFRVQYTTGNLNRTTQVPLLLLKIIFPALAAIKHQELGSRFIAKSQQDLEDFLVRHKNAPKWGQSDEAILWNNLQVRRTYSESHK